jgi:hypothetical protein
LEKIQNELNNIDTKGKSYKENMADKKLIEKFLPGNVAQQGTSKLSIEERIKRRLDHHVKLNFTDNERSRKQNDRNALGVFFKESFMPESDFIDQNINQIKNNVSDKIQHEFIYNSDKKYDIRAYIVIQYTLSFKNGDTETRYFNGNCMYLTSINLIKSFVEDTFSNWENFYTEAQKSSECTLQSIDEIRISTSKTKAIAGKSYIKLPDWIEKKHCCVNIKNIDEKCFKWALLASQNYENIKSKDKNETRHYKKYWDTIKEPENFQYPVKFSDIPAFEELNNMKINIVVIIDGEEQCKTKYTTLGYNERVVNLLYIEDDRSSHYVWIKNICGLYASQTRHEKKWMCKQCLARGFSNEEKLKEHIEYKQCQVFGIDQNNCKYIMPEVGNNKLKFENHNREFKHPFHIVADFECTLKKVSYLEDLGKKTMKYQKHQQNSYGLKYNSIHDKHSEEVKLFNSADPEEVNKNFIEELERLAKKSYDLLQSNKKNIIMTDEQKSIHYKNKNCNKCKCKYDEDNKKVRHHDHITGEFIDTMCGKCNLQYTYKRFIPVYIHNLKGYDSHLFLKSLYRYGYQNEDIKNGNITVIPNNEQKYISFSKIIKVGEYKNKDGVMKPITFEIRFIDSFGFMASGIESLTDNLRTDNHKIEKIVNHKGIFEQKTSMEFLVKWKNNDKKTWESWDKLHLFDIFHEYLKEHHMIQPTPKEYVDKKRKIFKNTSNHFKNDEQFMLMIQKGIYPYDYIDSFDRLNETKLPKIQKFYSILNKKHCDKKEYKRAQNVWDAFNCKTMLDYHNLYLITDVLLLADIWDNFREVCYKVYELDCSYYYTAPGLSYDAMLKCTGIEIDLLTDLDKFEFFEKGIRGGLSQISTRHAIANNKYMKNYDKSKEDSYIVYLDANALYSGAMCKFLPYKDFEWNNDVWTKEKILSIDDKADIGYTLSVDLHIPEHLHDKFNNYVPCPENIQIKKSFLSEGQQKDYKESKVKKLCTTFFDKIDYVMNYRHLKLVLSLGVELLKVNQVMQYKQKDFMKEYIMKNINLRRACKNEFEKSFYKLMCNSVYGRTLENVRNRINFRLISTEEQASLVKNMKSFTIFEDDLVGVHIHRQEIKLNKTIFLGQTILEDSKVLMYDFHYNFILKKIERENLDLLFTDTDSLCYHIRKQNIYDIIKANSERFDLSSYPKTHEMYDDVNDKALEKFKLEEIEQILEFIGLRAKLYTYTVEGSDENHNRCKGVKSSVVKNEIKLENYRNTLYSGVNFSVSQNNIRTYNHQLYSETCHKVALSSKDDKVYICENQVDTRNHGHYLNTI